MNHDHSACHYPNALTLPHNFFVLSEITLPGFQIINQAGVMIHKH